MKRAARIARELVLRGEETLIDWFRSTSDEDNQREDERRCRPTIDQQVSSLLEPSADRDPMVQKWFSSFGEERSSDRRIRLDSRRTDRETSFLRPVDHRDSRKWINRFDESQMRENLCSGFQKIDENQFGQYQCSAVNYLGEGRAQFSVEQSSLLFRRRKVLIDLSFSQTNNQNQETGIRARRANIDSTNEQKLERRWNASLKQRIDEIEFVHDEQSRTQTISGISRCRRHSFPFATPRKQIGIVDSNCCSTCSRRLARFRVRLDRFSLRPSVFSRWKQSGDVDQTTNRFELNFSGLFVFSRWHFSMKFIS